MLCDIAKGKEAVGQAMYKYLNARFSDSITETLQYCIVIILCSDKLGRYAMPHNVPSHRVVVDLSFNLTTILHCQSCD